MLIMCLFSLSAILAPVLIAIYILQPFTLGKEPTLMVPNWQNGAVKRLTICCLLRGAWSALQPVCARVCICVPACASVCPHVCVWYAGGGGAGSMVRMRGACVRRSRAGGGREGGVEGLSLSVETPPTPGAASASAPRAHRPAGSWGGGFAAAPPSRPAAGPGGAQTPPPALGGSSRDVRGPWRPSPGLRTLRSQALRPGRPPPARCPSEAPRPAAQGGGPRATPLSRPGAAGHWARGQRLGRGRARRGGPSAGPRV